MPSGHYRSLRAVSAEEAAWPSVEWGSPHRPLHPVLRGAPEVSGECTRTPEGLVLILRCAHCGGRAEHLIDLRESRDRLAWQADMAAGEQLEFEPAEERFAAQHRPCSLAPTLPSFTAARFFVEWYRRSYPEGAAPVFYAFDNELGQILADLPDEEHPTRAVVSALQSTLRDLATANGDTYLATAVVQRVGGFLHIDITTPTSGGTAMVPPEGPWSLRPLQGPSIWLDGLHARGRHTTLPEAQRERAIGVLLESPPELEELLRTQSAALDALTGGAGDEGADAGFADDPLGFSSDDDWEEEPQD